MDRFNCDKSIAPREREYRTRWLVSLHEFGEMDSQAKAERLLEASRTIIDSGKFSSNPRFGYDEWALCRVVPAIALGLAGSKVTLRVSEKLGTGEKHLEDVGFNLAKQNTLKNAGKAVLQRVTFRRAGYQLDDPVAEAARFLFGGTPNCCAISIGLDTLFPGAFPERVNPETLQGPNYDGYQLVFTNSLGRDEAVGYEETPEDLGDMFDAAVKLRASEDTPATARDPQVKLRDLISALMSAVRPHEQMQQTANGVLSLYETDIRACTAISIQTWSGNIVREIRFDEMPEPQPEF